MKILLFFLLFSLIIEVKSQITNIENYQTVINKAELAYIDGNKTDALHLYYDLLQSSNGNFCKDIFNGLIVSAELNEKDKFFEILQLLFVKGIPNDLLNETTEFEKYKTDRRWQEFLAQNSKYECPNPSLKSKIDSLEITDQYFRIKEGSYKVYRDTINKIDSMNILFLFSLVETNSFPSEDEIGVKNWFGGQGFDIVFHHYTQSTSLQKSKPKITPIIVNLVRQGKIAPNRACRWLEMQNGEFTAGVFDIFNCIVNGRRTNFFYPSYTYQRKVLIDEYRKWIYAEPIEDYYKKIAFKIKNPNNKMIFDVQLSTFEIDEEMFSQLTKNMIELK